MPPTHAEGVHNNMGQANLPEDFLMCPTIVLYLHYQGMMRFFKISKSSSHTGTDCIVSPGKLPNTCTVLLFFMGAMFLTSLSMAKPVNTLTASKRVKYNYFFYQCQ